MPRLAGPPLSFEQWKEEHPLRLGLSLDDQARDLHARVLQFREYASSKPQESGPDGMFFLDHIREEWFRERYFPSVLLKRLEEDLLKTRERLELFRQRITDGKVDLDRDLDFVEGSASAASNTSSCDSGDAALQRFEDFHQNALRLDAIDPKIARKDILEFFQKLPGFSKISFTEPVASRGFARFAWAFFDSKENAGNALKEVKDIQVSLCICIFLTTFVLDLQDPYCCFSKCIRLQFQTKSPCDCFGSASN